jgi:hypothetical protein
MRPARAQLREVASVTLGITLRGADASRHDPAGTHQLVRIGDLSEDGTVHCATPALIKIDPDAAYRYALRPGDVLLAARGARMTAGLFEDSRPSVAGGQFLVLRPHTSMLIPEYLRWFLNLPLTQEALAAAARGSYVRSLPISAVADMEIPVPPLPRQHAIASLHTLRLREKDLMARLAAQRALLVDHSILQSFHH